MVLGRTRIIGALVVGMLICGAVSCTNVNNNIKNNYSNKHTITNAKSTALNSWYLATKDAYVYPLSPYDSPDIWKTYLSSCEKWNALQIPTDMLEKMSTAGLVETCAIFPYYSYYIDFSDNYYRGIELTEMQFNGLQELYLRPDAGSELVGFYMNIDINNLYKYHKFPQYQLSYIELIISKMSAIYQMTREERSILMNSVLQNVYLRDSVYRFDMEDVSKALLLGRLLAQDSDEFESRLENETSTRRFLETGNRMDGNSVFDARGFIKSIEKLINK